jgi:hypothetical protein
MRNEQSRRVTRLGYVAIRTLTVPWSTTIILPVRVASRRDVTEGLAVVFQLVAVRQRVDDIDGVLRPSPFVLH